LRITGFEWFSDLPFVLLLWLLDLGNLGLRFGCGVDLVLGVIGRLLGFCGF